MPNHRKWGVEPPNEVRLVVQDDHDDYRIVWRDDDEALRGWRPTEGKRWFSEGRSEDPETWAEVTEDAVAVYSLTELEG